ncbi:hypothetical protein N8T08_002511 [Aspergillus melleus]|uniref:Uncharacterized protein n=1 Tax=Aspergillus melleus TaxID=138277 RepID=A0ACC3B8I1_9EURO|nr:hypothetical protein N8T08_002511 [Aspergillus melleus]
MCDNFRPANVLLDEDLRITGVVDWEFTYAAPVEFSYALPWWLLIEKPEYWPKGLGDWYIEYERQLQPFLGALMCWDDDAIEQGRMEENQRLSGPMRHSWESGDFWIAYAARNNFAFDAIYWENIYQRFFGTTDCDMDGIWRQRLDLLNDLEKCEMEDLVDRKTREMETRALAWDPSEYTLSRMNIAEMGKE